MTERAVLFLVATILMYSWTSRASAQWTITFLVNNDQATAVLGATRVGPMNEALNRVKTKLETILAASTGSALITVDWSAPPNPSSIAAAISSHVHGASATVARDKLINKASADNEPASEIALYEALPNGSVPYRYSANTPLNATQIFIPNSLNKHLEFAPTTDQNDGTIIFRPPGALTQWQFWQSKNPLPGHHVFEFVAFHEVLHVLGFDSAADQTAVPPGIFTWDLFRFGDSSIPVSSTSFTTLPRELRPTQEATGITALNSINNAYKLSRGTRAGGDGFQASHWRSLSRLNPPVAIGVMCPDASSTLYESLGQKIYTRADVEALDVIGWNVNPNSVQYSNTGTIELLAPLADARIAQGTSLTFEWGSTSFMDISVFIHAGTAIVDDNPVRVFYQLPGDTTSVTLPAVDALPPGEYVWTVVGSTQTGYRGSEDRRLTIVSGCDSIDFNMDGLFPDTVDIDDFLGVFAGGVCPSTGTVCNADIDFNNDGVFPDTLDIVALTLVFTGEPCP